MHAPGATSPPPAATSAAAPASAAAAASGAPGFASGSPSGSPLQARSEVAARISRAREDLLCFMCSIRRAVLVGEAPLAVGAQRGLDVVVGVGPLVAGRAIADLQQDDVGVGAVDEVMGVAGARLEADAHAGAELGRPGVGHQRGPALEHVHQLVLAGV